MRGSDPDAALYWLARMLEGGEDPLFIARRLVRMASEDIGEADPIAGDQQRRQGRLRLPGLAGGRTGAGPGRAHLAAAPKSNAVYTAFGAAMRAAKETGSLMPPAHIRNAPTRLMKRGYGKGYHYDHDTPEGFSGQNYFPEALGRQTFYDPPERGFEREIRKRLDYWAKLRERKDPHEPPRQETSGQTRPGDRPKGARPTGVAGRARRRKVASRPAASPRRVLQLPAPRAPRPAPLLASPRRSLPSRRRCRPRFRPWW